MTLSDPSFNEGESGADKPRRDDICKQAQQPPEDGGSRECSKVSSANHYLETLPRETTNSQRHVNAQADAVAGFSLLKGTPGLESRTCPSLDHACMCRSHEGSSKLPVRRPMRWQDGQVGGVKGIWPDTSG